jgi:hypothetical protein
VHSSKCTETRWVDTLYVRILESRTKIPLGEVLMWKVLSQDWKAGALKLDRPDALISQLFRMGLRELRVISDIAMGLCGYKNGRIDRRLVPAG